MTIAGGAKTTLTCQRSNDPGHSRCDLIETPGKGTIDPTSRSHTLPIKQLLGAAVQAQSLEHDLAYTVVLRTAHGNLPFSSLRASAQDAQTAVDRIHAFLTHANQTTLTLTYAYNTFPPETLIAIVGVYGSFLALAFLILLSKDSCIVSCRFDKAQGRLTMQTIGLGCYQVQEYALSQIHTVQFHPSVSFTSRMLDFYIFKAEYGHMGCAIAITTTQDEVIYLPPYDLTNREGKQRIAQQIQDFLDLPSRLSEDHRNDVQTIH